MGVQSHHEASIINLRHACAARVTIHLSTAILAARGLLMSDAKMLQNNEIKKKAIFQKLMYSGDMARKQANKPLHAAKNTYTIRWMYLLALY